MASKLPQEVKEEIEGWIVVEALDGHRCKLVVKKFSETTIDKLKSVLEWEYDCEKDEVKLMRKRGAVKLQDDTKSLAAYEIENGDTLQMTLAIRGGYQATCKISFPDITKHNRNTGALEGVERREIQQSGPKYHVVIKGMNFLAFCNHTCCIAAGKIVVVKIGMPKENIDFSYQLENLSCPACKEEIPSEDCMGMGLHKCKAHVDLKTADKRHEKYEIEAGDEFLQIISTRKEEKIEYLYIRIKLFDPTPKV